MRKILAPMQIPKILVFFLFSVICLFPSLFVILWQIAENNENPRVNSSLYSQHAFEEEERIFVQNFEFLGEMWENR